jgi:hypothetical protein
VRQVKKSVWFRTFRCFWRPYTFHGLWQWEYKCVRNISLASCKWVVSDQLSVAHIFTMCGNNLRSLWIRLPHVQNSGRPYPHHWRSVSNLRSEFPNVLKRAVASCIIVVWWQPCWCKPQRPIIYDCMVLVLDNLLIK